MNVDADPARNAPVRTIVSRDDTERYDPEQPAGAPDSDVARRARRLDLPVVPVEAP